MPFKAQSELSQEPSLQAQHIAGLESKFTVGLCVADVLIAAVEMTLGLASRPQ